MRRSRCLRLKIHLGSDMLSVKEHALFFNGAKARLYYEDAFRKREEQDLSGLGLLRGVGGPLQFLVGSSHHLSAVHPGLRFQIWSFALTLFPAFDFVFPFSPFSLFRAVFPFPPGKRFSLNAFSNNFQKNAAFWENPEKIWLKFGQNSAKFWEFCKIL